MKSYEMIAIGTGSGMAIVDAFLRKDPSARAAVIDKDEPGGICLTRGCIPSKILLYPAELVRTIQNASEFGIDSPVRSVDFARVMSRMRGLISKDINGIREGLSHSPNIDYFHATAEFTGPYTLRVDGAAITSKLILLGLGSRATVPPIPGLGGAGYLTSDTILALDRLPSTVAVIGGGYIAAELGFFLAAMGSKVSLLGRNPQFLPAEEPEVSLVAQRALARQLTIRTNCVVTRVERAANGGKVVRFEDRTTRVTQDIEVEEILVAAGREPTSDLLHLERTGVKTDERGWVQVDDHLATTMPGIWALGDATGRYPFKHKANYDAQVVYYNAVLHQPTTADYHAIPHAVFTHPEVASVGLRESEAIDRLGSDRVLVGVYRFEDTAKGEAMALHDFFVKVLVERDSLKILGAHIVGPHASILLQEIINLLYTPDRSARPILEGMHIHPALSEVVERAFGALTLAAHRHGSTAPGAS